MKTRRIGTVLTLAAIALTVGLEAAPNSERKTRGRRDGASSEVKPEINRMLMKALRQYGEAYKSGDKEKSRAIARRIQARVAKADQRSERLRQDARKQGDTRPEDKKRAKLQERRVAQQDRRGSDRRGEREDRDRKKQLIQRLKEDGIDREEFRKQIQARREMFQERKEHAQARRGRGDAAMQDRRQRGMQSRGGGRDGQVQGRRGEHSRREMSPRMQKRADGFERMRPDRRPDAGFDRGPRGQMRDADRGRREMSPRRRGDEGERRSMRPGSRPGADFDRRGGGQGERIQQRKPRNRDQDYERRPRNRGDMPPRFERPMQRPEF